MVHQAAPHSAIKQASCGPTTRHPVAAADHRLTVALYHVPYYSVAALLGRFFHAWRIDHHATILQQDLGGRGKVSQQVRAGQRRMLRIFVQLTLSRLAKLPNGSILPVTQQDIDMPPSLGRTGRIASTTACLCGNWEITSLGIGVQVRDRSDWSAMPSCDAVMSGWCCMYSLPRLLVRSELPIAMTGEWKGIYIGCILRTSLVMLSSEAYKL